jgi:hypothetical protein
MSRNQQHEGISSRLFKFIDLFGTEPKIKIQNNEKYNTAFGGVISIFFCITVLMGFIYFGQELIIRANPTVIVTNQFDIEPQRFNLTRNMFNYVFGIQDKDSQYYLDFGIFGIRTKMDIITHTVDDKGVANFNFDHVYLNVEKCDIDKHFPYFADQFADLDLANSLCFKPEDAEKLYIEGMWGSSHYTAISVEVVQCVNQTVPYVQKAAVCKSQAEIDEKLGGGFFSIYVTDTIFDPTNYTHPENHIVRNYYTSLSKNFFKLYELYFKNIDYVTDSGFLLEDKESKRYLMLDRPNEIFDFRDTDNFFSFLLRTSNNRDIYTRKYVKVQDILANMGGLIKGIMIAIQILFFLFQRTNYYFFLIEKLYTSYGTPGVSREAAVALQLPNISNSKIDAGLINNFISENKTISHYENNLVAKKMKDLASESKKVASLCNIITIPFMLCCGKKNRTVSIYECGKAKIDANTDIIKLYNLTEELELIKAIMFPDAGSKVLLDFLVHNKILPATSAHERVSLDDVFNNFKNLPSDGLNSSLKTVFETKLNILLNRTGNTLA